MSQWTFGRKLSAGFSVSAIALLIVSIMGYQTTERLIDNETWVAHTHQVRREIAELQSLLKDAETGQRGFVITGKEDFLEPYKNSVTESARKFEELQKSTVDNPEQQQRLALLRPLMANKFSELKASIEQRKAEGFEATSKSVAAGEGKKYMDEMRVILADMDRTESSLLDKRKELAETSAQNCKTVVMWGCILGLLAVVLIGWFIITSLTQQISGAVGHVQSSSAELQSAANQQVSGAKEQAISMNEITTTISELLVTSRQIAESAQRVAQIADQTVTGAKAGDQTVQKAHESVLGIRRQVDQIVAHMLELGKKSQQIGGILELINELSEQTNILSINATIEAAGAGDAGKRFAIVADEIRKLADRVGGSTKEIRGLIDEIRAAVNATVMATESGSKAVETGARQFNDVTNAFKQINDLVSTTTEAAREIQLSTKQQATAVEQVNLAISTVAQASKETEASSTQTFQTATQLTNLSRELARIIHPTSA